MESQGFQSCLENLQDDGTLDNIATVTLDMDNKSLKILEEFGFDKKSERFDLGHYKKNFDHRWKYFTDQYKNFEYVENRQKNKTKPGDYTSSRIVDEYSDQFILLDHFVLLHNVDNDQLNEIHHKCYRITQHELYCSY